MPERTMLKRRDWRGLAGPVFGLLLLGCTEPRPLGTNPGADAGGGAGGAAATCDVSSGLKLLGTPVQLLDHPPTAGNLYTSLVAAGAEHLFVWRIYAGDGVYMRRLDASGQVVGDNVRLRPYENAFDVAWSDGAQLGTVWTREEAEGVRRILFQGFDRLGNALTEPATVRASADVNIDGSVLYGPRIAAMGEGFVVVWAEGARVFIARLDRNGQLQGEPVLVDESDNHAYLNVAAGSESVLVGWTRGRINPTSTRSSGMSMVTRGFSPGLSPLGGTTILGEDPSFIGGHQLLSIPGGFVALWDSGLPPETRVQAAQLNATGINAGSYVMGAPVIGRYRYLSPAAWSRDRLVILWNPSVVEETGLTLSRFAVGGQRQGESLAIPSGPWTNRLHLTARDGRFAFTWSEESKTIGYRVYYQRGEACD